LAATQGHLDCVKFLVEKGAYIDHPDRLKRTPLIYAVKNGQLTVASYLVHMGAGCSPSRPLSLSLSSFRHTHTDTNDICFCFSLFFAKNQ
jgi:ankyrin repeat protein